MLCISCLQNMRGFFKTGTSEFTGCNFFFSMSLNQMVFSPSPNLGPDENFHLSHSDPFPRHLYHVKVVDLCLETGWEAASFTHGAFHPGMSWSTAHRGTCARAVCQSPPFQGMLQELPPNCWLRISHPFSTGGSLCHWPLSHHPQLGKPRLPHFNLYPSQSSPTSLDKPGNSPQQAIPGMGVGKGNVNTNYSFIF